MNTLSSEPFEAYLIRELEFRDAEIAKLRKELEDNIQEIDRLKAQLEYNYELVSNFYDKAVKGRAVIP